MTTLLSTPRSARTARLRPRLRTAEWLARFGLARLLLTLNLALKPWAEASQPISTRDCTA